MTISLLPSEIIYSIFEYLPDEDLHRAGLTCHLLHDISLSQRPIIPPKIVQLNALHLWNYPEENFTVDHKGQLSCIKWYHLLARFFRWINFRGIKERVNKTVETTFQEIHKLNKKGFASRRVFKDKTVFKSVYVWDRHSNEVKPANAMEAMLLSVKKMIVEYYSSKDLAQRILNSQQFKNAPAIIKAASLIRDQNDMQFEKAGNTRSLRYRSSRVLMEDLDIWDLNTELLSVPKGSAGYIIRQ